MKLSSKGKSVSLEIAFWWDPATKSIHIATNDKHPATENFHINVTNDGEKDRGHPALYKRLSECLKSMGAPTPTEG